MAKRDIDFLFEIGSLRNVPRAWQQVLTGKVQNISEHMFRTTMIGWIIAMAEKADVGKVIKMCLVHDIAESRAILLSCTGNMSLGMSRWQRPTFFKVPCSKRRSSLF